MYPSLSQNFSSLFLLFVFFFSCSFSITNSFHFTISFFAAYLLYFICSAMLRTSPPLRQYILVANDGEQRIRMTRTDGWPVGWMDERALSLQLDDHVGVSEWKAKVKFVWLGQATHPLVRTNISTATDYHRWHPTSQSPSTTTTWRTSIRLFDVKGQDVKRVFEINLNPTWVERKLDLVCVCSQGAAFHSCQPRRKNKIKNEMRTKQQKKSILQSSHANQLNEIFLSSLIVPPTLRE